jgi:hypothetical protein
MFPSCSTEPDHARHHAFIRDPFGFAVQERKAIGFGEEVYDSSVIIFVYNIDTGWMSKGKMRRHVPFILKYLVNSFSMTA